MEHEGPRAMLLQNVLDSLQTSVVPSHGQSQAPHHYEAQRHLLLVGRVSLVDFQESHRAYLLYAMLALNEAIPKYMDAADCKILHPLFLLQRLFRHT